MASPTLFRDKPAKTTFGVMPVVVAADVPVSVALGVTDPATAPLIPLISVTITHGRTDVSEPAHVRVMPSVCAAMVADLTNESVSLISMILVDDAPLNAVKDALATASSCPE